jgi:head-tail adaptor
MHRVQVSNPGPMVPDGDGGYTQTPIVSPDPWWVGIEPATARMRGTEQIVAGTVFAQATHVLRGRYRTDITTNSQILFGTRTFDVAGVQNVEEVNTHLLLFCIEPPIATTARVTAPPPPAPLSPGHTVAP